MVIIHNTAYALINLFVKGSWFYLQAVPFLFQDREVVLVAPLKKRQDYKILGIYTHDA